MDGKKMSQKFVQKRNQLIEFQEIKEKVNKNVHGLNAIDAIILGVC